MKKRHCDLSHGIRWERVTVTEQQHKFGTCDIFIAKGETCNYRITLYHRSAVWQIFAPLLKLDTMVRLTGRIRSPVPDSTAAVDRMRCKRPGFLMWSSTISTGLSKTKVSMRRRKRVIIDSESDGDVIPAPAKFQSRSTFDVSIFNNYMLMFEANFIIV